MEWGILASVLFEPFLGFIDFRLHNSCEDLINAQCLSSYFSFCWRHPRTSVLCVRKQKELSEAWQHQFLLSPCCRNCNHMSIIGIHECVQRQQCVCITQCQGWYVPLACLLIVYVVRVKCQTQLVYYLGFLHFNRSFKCNHPFCEHTKSGNSWSQLLSVIWFLNYAPYPSISIWKYQAASLH
jgi:hypothetical protein